MNESKSRIPHEKLVWHVLHKHFGWLDSQEREDAYGAGLLGLAKALKRFEPERGFEISSYACLYIYGEIHHYLRDRGLKPKVSAFYRDIYVRNRNRPDREACERENISLELWHEIRQACEVSLVNLDALQEHSTAEPDLDEEFPLIDEAVITITGWLESLSQRERDAVQRCLFDGEPFYKDLKLIRSAVDRLAPPS